MKEIKKDTPDIVIEKTKHGWKLKIQLTPIEWILVIVLACILISAELL